MLANEKMPIKSNYGELYDLIIFKRWKDSLKICEISESELDKVVKHLNAHFGVVYSGKSNNNPIEVTDIVSDNNGVIIFKPKQVDDNNSLKDFINNKIDWANKRVEITDKPFTVGQKQVLTFILNEIVNECLKPMKSDETNEAVELKYTTQEMIDAVNYGFEYAHESQNHTGDVPLGNILQWIMYKRNLLDVPKEFEIIKQLKK